jgi:hypothetical protein
MCHFKSPDTPDNDSQSPILGLILSIRLMIFISIAIMVPFEHHWSNYYNKGNILLKDEENQTRLLD